MLTLLIYLPAVRNGFVNWDDDLYIYDNIHIRSFDASFFHWAFLEFHISNWHPLTWISHALDYAFWGLNPLGHHLTSFLLHAVNTFLVFLLSLKLLDIAKEGTQQNAASSFLTDRAVLIAAGTTALLFGLHPVHVESVVWVSERKDLLCALFFLLSIMTYIKCVTGPNNEAGQKPVFLHTHYLFSLALFILALLSKPMAVTLPVVLLILDWYPVGRIRSFRSLWKSIVEKIPFFTLSFASSIITIMAQKAGGSIMAAAEVPFSIRAQVAIKALVSYLWKMLLPLDLTPFYPYPKNVSWLSFKYLSAVLIVTAITFVCVVLVRNHKYLSSALGYYCVTLLPVLGIIQVGNQSMADRYTYIPSIGPFIIAGIVIAWIYNKLTDRITGNAISVVSAALACVAVLSLSYMTFTQTGIWKNSFSLWNDVIEKQPETVLAYNNRGILFSADNNFARAISDFDKAIALDPSYYRAYNNKGRVFDKMNQFGMALEEYNKAIVLYPENIEAYNNRGLTYDKIDQLDRALADFNMVIALKPSYAIAYYNRGRVFNKLNQHSMAIADYDRAIACNPYYDEAYNNRGATFSIMGDFNRAVRDYDTTLLLNPTNLAAYYNRGLAFEKLGQRDKAAKDFEKAKMLSPNRQ